MRGRTPRGMAVGATLPSVVATLAWVQCCCGEVLATTVRPDETTGDVTDAVLRASGWDPAHDRCPACVEEIERRCPSCRCAPADMGHRTGCAARRDGMTWRVVVRVEARSMATGDLTAAEVSDAGDDTRSARDAVEDALRRMADAYDGLRCVLDAPAQRGGTP